VISLRVTTEHADTSSPACYGKVPLTKSAYISMWSVTKKPQLSGSKYTPDQHSTNINTGTVYAATNTY